MFCLFYNAKTKKVEAMNGSGRSSGTGSLKQMREDMGLKAGEKGTILMTSVHSVTVPGAAAGWVDTVEKFGSGKVSLKDVLTPAIELGEEGFPVSELASTLVSRHSDPGKPLTLTSHSGGPAKRRSATLPPTLARC